MATADISIFQGLLQPPKSVADYDAQAAQLQGARLQNQGAYLQNQIAQRGVDQDNQLQALMRGLPQGASDLERLAALRGAGRFDVADKLSTAIDSRTKTQAQAAKDAADAAGTNFKTQEGKRAARIQTILQFNTPDDVLAHLNDAVKSGELSKTDFDSVAHDLPTDPNQMAAWQLGKLRTALLTPEQQVKLTTPDANSRLSAETQRANNEANNVRMAAEGAANRGVTMRGQNLTDARSRDSIAATVGKPFEVTGPDGNPVLVQQSRDGTITPVEGYTPKATSTKPLPSTAAKGLLENQTNLRRAELALSLAEGQTVNGVQGDAEATGWKGYAPQALLNRLDEKGVSTRAAIADLGSLVLHDRSGAAVTAAEMPRLAPFIPGATDPADVVKKKLRQFVRNYRDEVGGQVDFYKASGYRVPDETLRGVSSGSGAAPQPTVTSGTDLGGGFRVK